jgi:hypothetical protein
MLHTQVNDSRDALQNYLLQADERAVFHALPHQIADGLNLAPRLTLELLVEAMFGGDTVLHWDLYCARCQFWTEEPDWLRHARHDYTCPGCGSTFDVHLDDEVQATFSPHPALRTLGPDADDAEFRRAMSVRFPPTTVHELMTVQAFRDWAQNEPLPAGEYLEVRRMTLWFSDLTGSTALYAHNGDPLAYDLVRAHFDLVFEAINRSEGAVVKTMGDGIMAVFTSSARAVEAVGTSGAGRLEPTARPVRRQMVDAQNRHPRRAVHRSDAQRPSGLLWHHGQRSGAGQRAGAGHPNGAHRTRIY